MNVLCLGPYRKSLEEALRSQGDHVSFTDEPLTLSVAAEFLVSFGYRHLISASILDRFPKRAVNVHISYLPWNRGADPNLWSFLENTPKGVTIHYMTPKIDGGDILYQEELSVGPQETLRTSYERLVQAGEALMARHWHDIRQANVKTRSQPEGGSFHRASDAEPYGRYLSAGWDTPVTEVMGKALKEAS